MTAEPSATSERDKSPLADTGSAVTFRGVLRPFFPAVICAASLGAAAGVMTAAWRLPDTVAALLTIAAATFAVIAGFLAVVTTVGAVTELVTVFVSRRRSAAEARERSAAVGPGVGSVRRPVDESGRR
ncbi:hypothetical protein ACWGJ9_11665 [Curtobacterium citreum]